MDYGEDFKCREPSLKTFAYLWIRILGGLHSWKILPMLHNHNKFVKNASNILFRLVCVKPHILHIILVSYLISPPCWYPWSRTVDLSNSFPLDDPGVFLCKVSNNLKVCLCSKAIHMEQSCLHCCGFDPATGYGIMPWQNSSSFDADWELRWPSMVRSRPWREITTTLLLQLPSKRAQIKHVKQYYQT